MAGREWIGRSISLYPILEKLGEGAWVQSTLKTRDKSEIIITHEDGGWANKAEGIISIVAAVVLLFTGILDFLISCVWLLSF